MLLHDKRAGLHIPHQVSDYRTTFLGCGSGFSAELPNAKNLIVENRRGEGELLRKTHPSGRGRDNFPRLEGGPHIFPNSPHTAFPDPTTPHRDPGRTHAAVGGSTEKGANAGSLSIRRDGDN